MSNFIRPSFLLLCYDVRQMYLEVLTKLEQGTQIRSAFDKALQSLPITQHDAIWDIYLPWVKEYGVEETAVRVYRRYIMFDSSKREDYMNYLLEISQWEEGIRQLSICVNDDDFISPSGISKHQMWIKLCDLCASHPEEASRSIKVDAVIRSGITRFSDEIGKLWCKLADYYTRMGQFERSRDIYEEGINSVITIRDFTIIFDSYVKFEEGILTAKMRMSEEEEDEEEAEEANEDVELRLARLEFLLDKRPMLLNAVALRQNPHNVQEWHKRVKLLKKDPASVAATFAEALKTVDPSKASGKLSSLWLAFADFYDKRHDIENARGVFQKASDVNFKTVDELAFVWCSWGEMELKHGDFNRALHVMQQAVTEPMSTIKRRRAKAVADGHGKSGGDTSAESFTKDHLHKSVTAWNLYLDLEESFGSTQSCRAAYERAIDLKVVTPQMALNFAAFLEERQFFEDSFQVFEKAILLFNFPHVKPIWLSYLDKFIQRYEGTKLERLRDIFEQAVSKVPPEDAAEFYIKYAKAEESYGLLRHAMSIYDRASRVVPNENRLDMFRLYIKKVEQHFGLTKTRPIYERAVSELNEDMCRSICIEFAEMERKLGEIDRARMILVHGSQFGDPKQQKDYWQIWREFEEAHGNEDTFREMLRIQRSVETAYSHTSALPGFVAATARNDMDADASMEPPDSLDAMARMAEDQAIANADAIGQKRKFVPASNTEEDAGAMDDDRTSAVNNPDEIEIDLDDETPVQKTIPSAVFGSYATAT